MNSSRRCSLEMKEYGFGKSLTQTKRLAIFISKQDLTHSCRHSATSHRSSKFLQFLLCLLAPASQYPHGVDFVSRTRVSLTTPSFRPCPVSRFRRHPKDTS